jgi:hypothetical protein
LTDFPEVRYVNIITLMMKAVWTSETSFYFRETTRRYFPQGYYLHTRRRANMKAHRFLHGFTIAALRATCPSNLTALDFITLVVSVRVRVVKLLIMQYYSPRSNTALSAIFSVTSLNPMKPKLV